VRTQDNREVTLFASPQSHFMINNQAGRFADLKVGTDINADFMAHNGQNMIGTLTVGAAGAQLGAAGQAQAQSPLLNGKVTRVVGNQVFIQTADGREMSLYFAPQPGMGLDAHAGLQSNAGLVWNGQAWVQQPGGLIQGNLQTDLNAQPGVNLGLQPFSGYYAPTVHGAVYTDFGAPVFYNDVPWRRPLLRIGAGLFGRIR
jgi:hypothetical protein